MVVLVNMPFCSLARPSLALSQFKAQLSAAGIPSRIENLNFDFARLIGVNSYEYIAKSQFGEWFFARDAWRGEVDTDLARLRKRDSPYTEAALNRIRDDGVPAFLDSCCDRLLADGAVRIVAFTCAFSQTIPSLALARRIKERSPNVKILFGGPNCHGEMGEEIIAKTGWIDVLATSEADDLLIPVCRRLLAGEDVEGLQGLARRTATGEIKSEPRLDPVSAELLEALPDPDYDDYIAGFASLDPADAANLREKTALLFEGSRGCWWGEKNHCTFCGLNSTGLTFRSKSPARVKALLSNLADKYPVRRLAASDNCMPIDFFKGLWPEFAGSDFSRKRLVFYEVKPNLGRSQLRLLSEAGVRYLQPGVETLSTNLLKCMRKGFTGLIHVYFLKLCRLFGIWPFWYFLVGIPGERPEDYRQIIRLLPLIRHFTPPRSGISPLQLHRFSPYYNDPERYLDRFSPNPWYEEIYPPGRVDLDRVAYFFTADWKNTLGSSSAEYQELDEQVLRWIESWVAAPQLPKLTYDFLSGERLELVDTRLGKQGLWSLDAQESGVYRAIDDPHTPENVVELTGAGSAGRVKVILDDFVNAGLAIEEGGRYLGLALPDSTPDFILKERKDLLLMQRINRQRSKMKKAGEASPLGRIGVETAS